MELFDIINFSALISKLFLFLINAVGLELMVWAYAVNRYTRPGRIFLLAAFYFLAWIDLDFISIQAAAFFPAAAASAVALWAM
ncbi:MAG: hypothetical protein WCX69_05350, partial [Candidatus Paceibacterota bacterium]